MENVETFKKVCQEFLKFKNLDNLEKLESLENLKTNHRKASKPTSISLALRGNIKLALIIRANTQL